MANCINKSSDEFLDLQQELGISPGLLAVKISLWQKENGLDNYPTISDLQVNSENEVNYNLKAVDILSSEKAKQLFDKHLFNESEITYTDEEGNPCAANGLNLGFTKGGTWKKIKNFKGKSHKDGGIDVSINIDKGTISPITSNPKFKAQYGVVLSNKTFNNE